MKRFSKGLLVITAALATTIGFGSSAFANSSSSSSKSSTSKSKSDKSDKSTSSAATQAADENAGEILGPSPKLSDPNRRGFFQVGIGPAFGISLDSDNILYNVMGSYNRRFNRNWTGKGFVDMYLSSGTESVRMTNFGVGTDYVFVSSDVLGSALPYVGGGVGLGNAQDNNGETETAAAVSLDGGVKFVTSDLNWDLNATYTLLTGEIDGSLPSVFGVRAAIAF